MFEPSSGNDGRSPRPAPARDSSLEVVVVANVIIVVVTVARQISPAWASAFGELAFVGCDYDGRAVVDGRRVCQKGASERI